MPVSDDAAVAIRRYDYSETSQVVTLFTRDHGKVRAIAKGIKRGTKTRVATGIDLLEIGRVVFTARSERTESLAIITEWKQTQPIGGLRRRLFRIYAGVYAAEITAYLMEDWDPHAPLFHALVSCLATLSDAEEPFAAAIAYQRAALTAAGSMPELGRCVLCGRERDLTHFAALEGGMVCRRCAAGLVEKREVTDATRRALARDDLRGSPTGVFRLLDYHIAHAIGRQPLVAASVLGGAD
ncbi:MAG: DNA repair protein RecO [Phycisphaerae bacterium]